MMLFTNRSRTVGYIVVGVAALVLGHSENTMACHGGGMGGGYGGGYSFGGGGGGYSYGGGYGNTMGPSAPSYGSSAGSWGQGSYGYGSQYPFGSQQGSLGSQAGSSGSASAFNNPATVLSYQSELNLTSKQVQALEKMESSGKQRAGIVLTQQQRKILAQTIGVLRR
jgi:hypothetical protein